jgi:hypothetical protein
MPKPRTPSDAPDELWPSRWMARALNLTPKALSKLVTEGVLPKHGYGAFDPIATMQAYAEYLLDGGPDDDELAEERVRLLRARRLMAEHELEQAKGFVEAHMLQLARAFVVVARTMFLDLPGRLAPRLALATTPKAAFALLDAEIRMVLERLAKYDQWDKQTHLPRSTIEEDDEETTAAGDRGAHRTNGAAVARDNARAAAAAKKEGAKT